MSVNLALHIVNRTIGVSSKWCVLGVFKHRLNNLSHLLKWNMRDISLSGYIFTCPQLVKIRMVACL